MFCERTFTLTTVCAPREKKIHDVCHVCAHGGFNLPKFVSNSKIVPESIPEGVRAPEVRSLQLGSDYYPVERALGVESNRTCSVSELSSKTSH